jgi:hypothetical protein
VRQLRVDADAEFVGEPGAQLEKRVVLGVHSPLLTG